MSGSCLEVNVIVTGTGTNDNLQVLGCVHYLGVDFVRADNDGINVGNSCEQLCLISILFKQCKSGKKADSLWV